MSPSTPLPPSRRRHGCFLMLMSAPLMPEVSPSMLSVSLFMLTWPIFMLPRLLLMLHGYCIITCYMYLLYPCILLGTVTFQHVMIFYAMLHFVRLCYYVRIRTRYIKSGCTIPFLATALRTVWRALTPTQAL